MSVRVHSSVIGHHKSVVRIQQLSTIAHRSSIITHHLPVIGHHQSAIICQHLATLNSRPSITTHESLLINLYSLLISHWPSPVSNHQPSSIIHQPSSLNPSATVKTKPDNPSAARLLLKYQYFLQIPLPPARSYTRDYPARSIR